MDKPNRWVKNLIKNVTQQLDLFIFLSKFGLKQPSITHVVCV